MLSNVLFVHMNLLLDFCFDNMTKFLLKLHSGGRAAASGVKDAVIFVESDEDE